MSDWQIKEFKILQDFGDSYLPGLGFNRVKTCGRDLRSFILLLGFHYIESLILRQNSCSNNFIFLQPCLESLGYFSSSPDLDSNDLKFKYLFQLFKSIEEKKAGYEKFLYDIKSNFDVVSEVLEFSLNVLNIPGDTEQVNQIIYNCLPLASRELNLQFIFYSESSLLLEVKNNNYFEPSVLNFLYVAENDTFFQLYHCKFSEISAVNFNVSFDFNPNPEGILDEPVLTSIKSLVTDLTSNLNLDPGQMAELKSIIEEMKELDSCGHVCENLVNSVLKNN